MAAIAGPQKKQSISKKNVICLYPACVMYPYGHLGDYSRSLMALVASS